jgi:hypothetical protein
MQIICSRSMCIYCSQRRHGWCLQRDAQSAAVSGASVASAVASAVAVHQRSFPSLSLSVRSSIGKQHKHRCTKKPATSGLETCTALTLKLPLTTPFLEYSQPCLWGGRSRVASLGHLCDAQHHFLL